MDADECDRAVEEMMNILDEGYPTDQRRIVALLAMAVHELIHISRVVVDKEGLH